MMSLMPFMSRFSRLRTGKMGKRMGKRGEGLLKWWQHSVLTKLAPFC